MNTHTLQEANNTRFLIDGKFIFEVVNLIWYGICEPNCTIGEEIVQCMLIEMCSCICISINQYFVVFEMKGDR